MTEKRLLYTADSDNFSRVYYNDNNNTLIVNNPDLLL